MKRGTPAHPKMLALERALKIPRYAVVGVLESLWHFASAFARRGDVGRYEDEAIAEAIGWEGDPGGLINALVSKGWLDACPCHRLRIHDWPEHSDQAVHKTKEVLSKGFLECYVSGDVPEEGYPKDGDVQHGAQAPPSPATATATATEQGKAKAPVEAGGVQGGNGLENYCRAVWDEHCRRRGSPFPDASPVEFDLMRSWYEAHIPVRVVLRGLSDTKAAKPNLTYYGPSVAEAVAHWRRTVPA